MPLITPMMLLQQWATWELLNEVMIMGLPGFQSLRVFGLLPLNIVAYVIDSDTALSLEVIEVISILKMAEMSGPTKQ